jgi:hypothetical protein
MVKEKSKNLCANLKKKQPEQQPALDPKKVLKMPKTLHQPGPRLISDYDCNILKSHNVAKRSRSSSASGKSVPQFEEQKNPCPPLQVFPEVQYDPEIVALYKEAADAHGMSIAQYLSKCDFPMGDIAFKYRHGNPLVRYEDIPNLPTRM